MNIFARHFARAIFKYHHVPSFYLFFFLKPRSRELKLADF
ncbi:hypothetical protein PUN28_011750 [Cardiocondyla obscurior]|uniref:Uncharacterized protein n=1 Tax=Cardiocondyla obscurior TaxID=286306 RepID=A0AAW2FKK4_9HYME